MRAAHNGVKEHWRKMLNRDVTTGVNLGDLEALYLKKTQKVLGVIVWDDDQEEAHLTLRHDVKGDILMADAIMDVQSLLEDYYSRYFAVDHRKLVNKALRELEK